MSSRLQRELAALDALSAWMREADNVRQLFAEAGVPMPARLVQFFGAESTAAETKIIIPPPPSPRRPAGADSSSIWVPWGELLVRNLVLGILRESQAHMTPKAIIEAARRRGVVVQSEGSVANLGKPLESKGTIGRSDAGWVLKRDREAPLLVDGFAWGAPDIFTVQEVAAHRRQLILHVLKLHPSGLQQAQLVDVLGACEWVADIPVSKDLVKMDLEALSSGQRVRRIGNSSKWECTPM